VSANQRLALKRVVICTLAGCLLAVIQMSPQRHAWWGLMDDHEMLEWRAPGTSLRLSDVPRVIMTRTETGEFGRSPRYRPVYYAVHVLESWAWGADPALWYRARMAIFAAMIAGAALALWLFAGPWLAAGASAFLLSGWYWRDIWAHLGPAEQYASLGTALVAIGAAMVWRTAAISAGLWLAAAGTAFAAGCKENFVVLLVPLACVAWHARSTHRREALGALAFGGAGAGLIVIAVALGLRHASTDIYGTPLAPAARLWWIHGMPAAAVLALWAAFALCAIVVKPREVTRDMAALLVVVTALIVSQATYYAPVWPRFGSRYDFPGRLADVLLLVGASVCALRWLRLNGRTRAARWLEPALSLLFVLLAARHLELPVRSAAEANAASTWALRDVLYTVRDSVAARPGTSVVIESQGAGEPEPSIAVVTLLSELGVRGPYYTSLTGLPASSEPAVVLTLRGYQAPTIRFDPRR
jgi:hypothetical protein